MNTRETVADTRFGDLFNSRSDRLIVAPPLRIEIMQRAR